MSNRPFTKGLHDLGNGCWGYVLPDGSWGWSNSGLIADSGESLMVDTLFDLNNTAEMLRVLRATIPAASRIGVLVNTHADGDHTFGNQLVEGARIIATTGTAADFDKLGAKTYQAIIADAPNGKAEAFFADCMRPFDFSQIVMTPPTETFSGEVEIKVGNKRVVLIEVGPAHSLGDALVYVPEDRVIYTGDILFNEGTPIAWYGPVARWIRACNLILDLDVETVMPGHGPVTDKDGVRRMRDYLVYVSEQARGFYDAGLDYLQAAYRIDLGAYRDWNDAERIVVTLRTLYDDFDGAQVRPYRPPVPFFGLMKDFRDHLGRGRVHPNCGDACGCSHEH